MRVLVVEDDQKVAALTNLEPSWNPWEPLGTTSTAWNLWNLLELELYLCGFRDP